MIKAIIVDDALQIRRLLRLMLGEIAEDVSIVGEAENSDQALELIRSEKPDLVFLDIEIPGKNGLDLVEEIAKEENEFQVIFVTAFNQYAVQAFRLSAVDYLLKPIREKELREALDKTRRQSELMKSSLRYKFLSDNLKIQKNNTLCIPFNYGYEYLSISDIEYVEADNVYAHIYLQNGERKMISKHLKYFEDCLGHLEQFIKVHRSFIVNLNQMSSFRKEDRGIIVMKNGREISLSRSHRENFLQRIGKI